MMGIEYESASMLLKLVPHSKGHLDEENQRIDWAKIIQAMDEQPPSTGERVIIQAALAMWTGKDQDGGGFMAAIQWLDEIALETFFSALEVRAGVDTLLSRAARNRVRR